MTTTLLRSPVVAGEPAPDFALPAVDGNGTVSLSDYRGKSSVFLALFIGLWCPFCRRAIAQLAANENKLKPFGVESLGIVATVPENARLYFKFRPCRVRLGSDPGLSTHRAYGLPKPDPTPEFMRELATMRVNPDGQFPEPLSVMDAAAEMTKRDGYTNNETDNADIERQWPQFKGQFLVDREGLVRWANVDTVARVAEFPSADEILTVARAMPRG